MHILMNSLVEINTLSSEEEYNNEDDNAKSGIDDYNDDGGGKLKRLPHHDIAPDITCIFRGQQ